METRWLVAWTLGTAALGAPAAGAGMECEVLAARLILGIGGRRGRTGPLGPDKVRSAWLDLQGPETRPAGWEEDLVLSSVRIESSAFH